MSRSRPHSICEREWILLSNILLSPVWASGLISSSLDVDRLDYLQRDALSVGWARGEVENILDGMKIIDGQIAYDYNVKKEILLRYVIEWTKQNTVVM